VNNRCKKFYKIDTKLVLLLLRDDHKVEYAAFVRLELFGPNWEN